MTNRFAVRALLCVVLGVPSASRATTVLSFSFDSLCASAPRIAHVVCVDTHPVASDDAVGVRTETRFRMVEEVRGDGFAEFTIALPGGRLGDRHVTVPGMPAFVPGEEYVVFLTGSEGGSAWPVGLQQGCFPVSLEEGAREVELRPGVTPAAFQKALKPTASGTYRVGLKDFLNEVRRAVGASGPPGRP